MSGFLSATVGVSSKSLIEGLEALQANNFDTAQLTAIQSAAEAIANYTSCINTDKFEAVDSEADLEKQAFNLSKSKHFLAGMIASCFKFLIISNIWQPLGNQEPRW